MKISIRCGCGVDCGVEGDSFHVIVQGAVCCRDSVVRSFSRSVVRRRGGLLAGAGVGGVKIETLEKRSMLTDVYASLAILPIEVDEGAGFSVAVTLTDPNWTPGAQPPVVHPATTVTLQFAESATQGEDYTVSSATISIPAWSGRSVGGSITLTVLRDNRVEGDEEIEVSVGAGAGYTLQQPAGTITTTTRTTVIKDDPPRVSIWIAEGQTGAVREATIGEPRGSAPLGAEDPPASTVLLYVLRSGGNPHEPLLVTLTTSGSASASDFSISPSLTLHVGVYAELQLTASDDALTEADESIVVSIAESPSTYLVDLAQRDVNVTIIDDLIDYSKEWRLVSAPTGSAPRIIQAMSEIEGDVLVIKTAWERLTWVSQALAARSDRWGGQAIINGSVQRGEQVIRSTENSAIWTIGFPNLASIFGAQGALGYSVTVTIGDETIVGTQFTVQAGPDENKMYHLAVYLERVDLVYAETRYRIVNTSARDTYEFLSHETIETKELGYTGVYNTSWKAETERRFADEEAPAPLGFKRGSTLDLPHLSPLTVAGQIRKGIPPSKPPGSSFGGFGGSSFAAGSDSGGSLFSQNEVGGDGDNDDIL